MSPLTTKGDIWGFTTVDARIPVGSNGQILIVDSAQPTGVRWATGSGVVDPNAWHNTPDSFGSQKSIGTADNFDFVIVTHGNEVARVTTGKALIVRNDLTPITVPYHSYFVFSVNGSSLIGNVNNNSGSGVFAGFEATTNPDATGTFSAYMLLTGENYSGHGFSGYDGIFGIGTGCTAMRLYTPGTQDIILYPNTTEVGRLTDVGGGHWGLRMQRPGVTDSHPLVEIKNVVSTEIARMSWTGDVCTAEIGIVGSAGAGGGKDNNDFYFQSAGGAVNIMSGSAQVIKFSPANAESARFLPTGELMLGPPAVTSGGRFSSSYHVEVVDNINDIIGTVSWNKDNGTVATAVHAVANDASHQGQFGITSSSSFTTASGLAADEVFVRGLSNNVVISAGGSHNIRLLSNGSPIVIIDSTGVLPGGGDASGSLGKSGDRWSDIWVVTTHIGDLNLDDDEMDSHWTVREAKRVGEDPRKLYAIDRVTGDRYEINMTRVAA